MKILLIFFLLTGCSTFLIKEKEKEKQVITTDETVALDSPENIIACIKLKPECVSE